jgi:hypothetical protein
MKEKIFDQVVFDINQNFNDLTLVDLGDLIRVLSPINCFDYISIYLI